jgi:hypothetical protein
MQWNCALDAAYSRLHVTSTAFCGLPEALKGVSRHVLPWRTVQCEHSQKNLGTSPGHLGAMTLWLQRTSSVARRAFAIMGRVCSGRLIGSASPVMLARGAAAGVYLGIVARRAWRCWATSFSGRALAVRSCTQIDIAIRRGAVNHAWWKSGV